MSIVIASSVPDPTPASSSAASPAGHDPDHTWQLRGVEYDEGVAVSQYECDACDEVWFA